MSWNGATEVTDWKVYHAGENGKKPKEMAKIPRSAFESSAWTNGYGTHVFVEAFDKNGEMLGRSNVFASLPPRNVSQSGFEVDDHYAAPESSAALSSEVMKATTVTVTKTPKPTKAQETTKAAEPTYIVVAPEGTEAEDEMDDAEESYIESLIYDSRATMAFGIVIGIAISCGLVCSGVFRRCLHPSRGSSLAWWRQKGETYKPVDRDEREDEFELGDYSEEEDGMSESKSKSPGSR